ncbi:MAG: glycosyltransferase WbuB [Alphaproteobacteria bacterium]|nr:glycosyltransferase WbuB [Alphaproteobacteria bacterium]
MSQKGHILVINRVFPPDTGASGLRLMELCQGLAQKNWRITVLTNKGRNVSPPNLHANIRVARLPFGSLEGKPSVLQYFFWLWALFFRALFMGRADVTLTVTDPPMSALITAFLRFFKGTRTVHWVHDLYPELLTVTGRSIPVVQNMLEGIAHWALCRQDRIVAIGQDMADIIRPSLSVPGKIVVIPNWPDVQSALLDKKKPVRHDSQNPYVLEGMFTVLYSGNFGMVHEFGPIIDAINIVGRSPHPIRFIFAGDGPKFTEVRDRIDALMLNNVHFIRAQPRDKFIDMLLAGDLHMATLVPEAAGLVAPSKINSALGLGRPCIYLGSPKSSQAKLIRDYKAGAVIDGMDPKAKFLIAEAIINYAVNEDEFAEAQTNAIHAAESISFDKAVKAFDELCLGLLRE